MFLPAVSGKPVNRVGTDDTMLNADREWVLMSGDDPSSVAYMSPEHVALQLVQYVLAAEGRPVTGEGAAKSKLSRNLILDAYADCLEAVKGGRPRRSNAS